jgi:hypothetical protein
MKAAALAMLLLALGLAQAAAQPFVRVEIKPAQPVLVGQQVRISVTVLAPNFFLSPPQFPMFDIPGAIIVLPHENALNSTEAVNGATYAGITRDYLITPQRAGDFTLPPAQIPFSYAADPGKPGVPAVVTLPPQKFAAALPQGAQTGASTSLVGEVEIKQTIDGDPKNMKVGDALTRTVEIFAPNTQAMMIPPTNFAAPAGVRVYPRDPILTDVTSDRGGFAGGRRVDQATYVFERPGAYALPAVEAPWFNAQSKRQEVAKAPEIDVAVAEAPSLPADLAPPAEPAVAPSRAPVDWRPLALAIFVLVAATFAMLWAWRRYRPRIRDWIFARRRRREASEAAAFAKLAQACRESDAAAAYRELGVWARRAAFGAIDALCEREPALGKHVILLERRLYAGGPRNVQAWNGRPLLDSAKIVRVSRRSAIDRANRRPPALPALNPQ